MRRSPGGPASPASGVPQRPQKLSEAGASLPHSGQARGSGWEQLRQLVRPAGFASPQAEQFNGG